MKTLLSHPATDALSGIGSGGKARAPPMITNARAAFIRSRRRRTQREPYGFVPTELQSSAELRTDRTDGAVFGDLNESVTER